MTQQAAARQLRHHSALFCLTRPGPAPRCSSSTPLLLPSPRFFLPPSRSAVQRNATQRNATQRNATPATDSSARRRGGEAVAQRYSVLRAAAHFRWMPPWGAAPFAHFPWKGAGAVGWWPVLNVGPIPTLHLWCFFGKVSLEDFRGGDTLRGILVGPVLSSDRGTRSDRTDWSRTPNAGFLALARAAPVCAVWCTLTQCFEAI